MKVTECHSVAGFTVIGIEGKFPPQRKSVLFDGVEHPILIAYDIGERIAIRGEFDLLGKDVSIS